MNQVYPDEGLLPTLVRALPSDMWYWLFTNNVTPDQDTILSGLTADTTIGSIDVNGTDFTLTGVAGHVARVVAPDIAFENTTGSPRSVYGYFASSAIASGAPSGTIVLAARFDSAPIAIAAGGFLPVTPTLALKQE